MNKSGIYDQLITQLVEQNLDRDFFYFDEAATWLSRFLTRIIEIAIDSVLGDDNRINEQISLANTIDQSISTRSKIYNA
jgi:hypothetical protein